MKTFTRALILTARITGFTLFAGWTLLAVCCLHPSCVLFAMAAMGCLAE